MPIYIKHDDKFIPVKLLAVWNGEKFIEKGDTQDLAYELPNKDDPKTTIAHHLHMETNPGLLTQIIVFKTTHDSQVSYIAIVNGNEEIHLNNGGF